MNKPVMRTLALTAVLAMVSAAPAMAAGSDDNDANGDADLPHVNYEVEVRLARGAEQEWYFDWITIEIEELVEEPEAPEGPQEPTAKQDCKDGGWADQEFRNQGQCIASVVANERSVHGSTH